MSRRDALRSYLLEVVRDLVERGAVKQRAGQSLADVLRTEPRAVLGEVQDDLAAVAREIGAGLLGGLQVIASKQVDTLIGAGVRAIAEKLAAGKRR